MRTQISCHTVRCLATPPLPVAHCVGWRRIRTPLVSASLHFFTILCTVVAIELDLSTHAGSPSHNIVGIDKQPHAIIPEIHRHHRVCVHRLDPAHAHVTSGRVSPGC